MIRPVSFTFSGKPVRPKVDDGRMLLWVLRSELGLTGTKFGCGEPPIVCMGAVIANAIHDAVGARLLQLPMTPARIKAALSPAQGPETHGS